MKPLEVARERVRTLVRREGAAFIAGTGLLVVGGLLDMPASMVFGLVLLGVSRRVQRSLEKMRAMVFGLELARDASENEGSSVALVAPLAEPEPRAERTPFAVRAFAAVAVVSVLAVLASFFHAGVPAARHQRWTFLEESPLAIATEGAWTIEHHPAATGGRALAKDIGPSPLLVAMSGPARDVRAMTRCKGGERKGCGLAFRIADDRSFTVARVAGDRVELVRVDDGRESSLGTRALPPGGGDVWQELHVEARGDVIRVTMNGAGIFDVHDPRPAVAGGVGLWAPARAWFDELAIEMLAASPQAIEMLPFLRRPS